VLSALNAQRGFYGPPLIHRARTFAGIGTARGTIGYLVCAVRKTPPSPLVHPVWLTQKTALPTLAMTASLNCSSVGMSPTPAAPKLCQTLRPLPASSNLENDTASYLDPAVMESAQFARTPHFFRRR
jgi:hypothetical protein